MIKNLSPSRASQFKTCPKQFKFANVDKIKEPTTEVQAKGTTVHQALEDLYDLPKEERTPENLYNLFRSCLLYTSPSPRDRTRSRMPSSA